MSGAVNVRLLYRHILRHATQYPSVKREAIVADIKAEFRRNRHLQDPQQIRKEIDVAKQGLQQLQMYSGLRKSEGPWEVHLTGTGGAGKE
mmetsp:Transcript_5410/g.19790  ORF Transcript_5410/g.19790 Transcript_5410/m.19790 type:complete len:90 (-) Transcript_5410:1417-1686(-)